MKPYFSLSKILGHLPELSFEEFSDHLKFFIEKRLEQKEKMEEKLHLISNFLKHHKEQIDLIKDYYPEVSFKQEDGFEKREIVVEPITLRITVWSKNFKLYHKETLEIDLIRLYNRENNVNSLFHEFLHDFNLLHEVKYCPHFSKIFS